MRLPYLGIDMTPTTLEMERQRRSKVTESSARTSGLSNSTGSVNAYSNQRKNMLYVLILAFVLTCVSCGERNALG
ncbi:hypothetical protein DPMN_147850 [Dreissena polymorpha]|uniref:Uncharacterized protein n=1 Tax=Dreissena polymorpha TaxID=45954 RepID=A0A9D4F8H1_DREPO|nr:hypothetical protein DPMN_147850 [Dreissena polymorpha]